MPCTATSSREWNCARARLATTLTAIWGCMRWATSPPSARTTSIASTRPGYAGTTLIGKLGVESAYETRLHGLNGYQQILVNAQGRSVKFQGAYQPDLQASAPVPGTDLLLAIDLPAQQAAEAALGERRGAVVAIDPANGDVLALVSHPGFDPTLFSRGLTRAEYAVLINNEDKPLLNRALRGTYPSGSTIKADDGAGRAHL